MNRGTASGRELKEQNSPIVVVKVADSPSPEPLLRFLIVNEQRRVEVAGAKGVGIDYSVEELRGIVMAPRDETDDHHSVGGARERRRCRRRGMVGGGGGGGGRANEDSNRRRRRRRVSWLHSNVDDLFAMPDFDFQLHRIPFFLFSSFFLFGKEI